MPDMPAGRPASCWPLCARLPGRVGQQLSHDESQDERRLMSAFSQCHARVCGFASSRSALDGRLKTSSGGPIQKAQSEPALSAGLSTSLPEHCGESGGIEAMPRAVGCGTHAEAGAGGKTTRKPSRHSALRDESEAGARSGRPKNSAAGGGCICRARHNIKPDLFITHMFSSGEQRTLLRLQDQGAHHKV